MPPYIPLHLEVVYLTGLIEIMLALGLMVQASRKISAVMTALYFVAIIPAHLHVCLNNVEMFGIISPTLLWLRLVLQIPLIAWAYSLRRC